ncbi:hypothetical protein SOCE26_034170 [Sorangium cellulosum]|uniref:Uncharacterized protein n=1 Tax=Sorangium cellulosum TaxID=56 RepID=A0A2L0ERW1_SORCE|nr:hypothetical protein [Sorangium cellulosum]AUX41992.1 hypothetical protein SOCE26_034170 [Sorangium cellulosum]
MSEPDGRLHAPIPRWIPGAAPPFAMALLLGASAAGCGGRTAAAPAGGAASSGRDGRAHVSLTTAGGPLAPGALVTMVTPSVLLPDLVGERGVVASESGSRRVLIDRMRAIAHDDGSLERAAELFPSGQVTALKLPTRLGDGYLFYASNRGIAQLWRAKGWLAALEPLVQLPSEANEVIAGFDRLYVRLAHNHRLLAIDAQSGAAMPLGPLPPAGAYGQLAFADGWRGVVEADLRGLLVTFDAGTTWREVEIEGRPTALSVIGGDPAVVTANGFYAVDARGGVTYRALEEPEDAEEPPARAPGPLGRRPLRAAVEDGWPDSSATAVVARGGALARVSLRDGAVVDLAPDAYPERQATCHAVRAGASFGFVCGEREGPTTLYAFQPPLGMRRLMRFDKPRFVAASGNGALVIRGSCGEDSGAHGGRAYCIVAAGGDTREIRVSAPARDVGVERVIALSDGRVAVLSPPRLGAAGQLTLLQGSDVTTVPLLLPSKPRSVARDLQRGMWLEGFEEREPGVLGGWVEAGGPIAGVRIDVKTGHVTAGAARQDGTGALLSGRFALSLGGGERAAESTDGGVTWHPIELPERDDDTAASPTRACGPVGCVFKGWIRVGWGKTALPGDLAEAKPPPAMQTPTRTASPIAMRCEPLGASTPPLPDKPAAAPPARPAPPGVRQRAKETAVSAWAPFRNTAPPALGADETGFDNGAPYDIVSTRAYVWGKRGADWARAGRWLIRFDDRFDPDGGVRSSAVSASPWSDEASAAEAIGAITYGAASWGAYLDPGGRAALTHVCRGGGCGLFAVSEGLPILPLRDGAGRSGAFLRPFPNGAVRLGETWFFVSPGGSYEAVNLWRADLGIARQLATYARPARVSYGVEPPRLVRRALGGGVGLLISTAADPGARAGAWHVLPIDRDTGALGEAIPLGRKDLTGTPLERCHPGQDGWLLDTGLEGLPSFDLGGAYPSVDGVEFRLRLDPGVACVEAMSVRLQAAFTRSSEKQPEVAASGIPLAATERATGRRWRLRCEQKDAAR